MMKKLKSALSALLSKLKGYFRVVIIRTKEQEEQYRKLPYVLVYDSSEGKTVKFFNAFLFHQRRALLYIRFSNYDIDVKLFFDFITITFNWSLR